MSSGRPMLGMSYHLYLNAEEGKLSENSNRLVCVVDRSALNEIIHTTLELMVCAFQCDAGYLEIRSELCRGELYVYRLYFYEHTV